MHLALAPDQADVDLAECESCHKLTIDTPGARVCMRCIGRLATVLAEISDYACGDLTGVKLQERLLEEALEGSPAKGKPHASQTYPGGEPMALRSNTNHSPEAVANDPDAEITPAFFLTIWEGWLDNPLAFQWDPERFLDCSNNAQLIRTRLKNLFSEGAKIAHTEFPCPNVNHKGPVYLVIEEDADGAETGHVACPRIECDVQMTPEWAAAYARRLATEADVEDKWGTYAEAATLVGLSPAAIRQWASRGHVRTKFDRKRVVVSLEDCMARLAERNAA